ncbi:MAG: gamma-glutamyltransferase, partial [Streptosporangiales bacterium]|nr:gamma-glutamyltransferase [Streptosporangiales bacterium]
GGYGPDGGEPGFYRERGLRALPVDGPLAVAVPGAMGTVAALHRAAATRPLAELWAPAIAAAAQGVPCTTKTRGDVVELEERLSQDAGLAEVFLPGGRPPRVGEPVVHADLAATLRTLAADPGAMYRGALSERAVAALRSAGAPFSGEEWALAEQVSGRPALTGSYRGHAVHQTPPPTPGWMVLQQAGICDGVLAGLPWLDAEAVHWLASAARIAFTDRYDGCGDANDHWRALLTPESLASRRDRISAGEPLPGAPALRAGDTTSMAVADGDGWAVSIINSLAFTFGARISVPGTGITLNNRLGRGAYLVDGHPNEVRPRRRPLHTLNAWMITDASGRLRHVGNTPGGDGQVQWNTQVISHLLDHGADPATAVAAPRFTVFPGSDADVIGQPPQLRAESRLGPQRLAALSDLGHDVRDLGPWGAGGAMEVISIDPNGSLQGASDPRQDGTALGH